MTLTKNGFRFFLITILLALLVRFVFLFALAPWQESGWRSPLVYSDAAGYHKIAIDLISKGVYEAPGRTPGFPLILAYIYLIFGVKPWAAVVFQIFLDIGTLLLIYLIAAKVFKSQLLSLSAAFLYAINLLNAYFTNSLYSDSVFTFFVTLSIFLFILALQKKKYAYFVLAGLCIGWTALVKPIFVYTPFVFLPVIFLNEVTWKQKIQKALVLFFSFLFVISLWQLRNYEKYGYYSVSIRQQINLLEYNLKILKMHVEDVQTPGAAKTITNEFKEASFEAIENPFEKAANYQKVAIPYILEHLPQYLKLHLKGIFYLFFMPEIDPLSTAFGNHHKPIHSSRVVFSGSILERLRFLFGEEGREYPLLRILLIKTIIEYFFIAVGLIAFFIRKESRLYIFFFLLFLFYFANATSVAGGIRFRVPLVPVLTILMASGLFVMLSKFTNKANRVI